MQITRRKGLKNRMKRISGKLSRGNELMSQGQYQLALGVYREFIEAVPENMRASVWFNINLAERKLGFPLSEPKFSSANDESVVDIPTPNKLPSSIVGYLNRFPENPTRISGWAYDKAQNKQVSVSIYIDGSWVRDLSAAGFRQDLKDKAIGNGFHAYSMEIPLSYLDGRLHSVIVRERTSGKVCGEGKFQSIQIVDYTDFDGLKKHNIVNPLILAPFDENKKRCLAYMDVVAKSLSGLALRNEKVKKVSVLMAAFNREECILEAVESVLRQKYSNFELLIGDDGSSDGTVKVLGRINDSRVRVIPFNENRGKSAVLNDLFKLSTGDLIAYLDTDNTWEPEYLAAMVGAYLKVGGPVLYSGQYLYSGVSDKPYAVRYAPFNRNLLLNRNFIDHNSFVHERSVYYEVSGYDERLRRCLDYDFIIKACTTHRTVSVPVCLTNYFYEKVDNSITSNKELSGDVKEVLARAQRALVDSRRVHAPYLDKINKAPCSRITVVVPSFESLEDLKDCVTAIDDMEERAYIDLVIVDNNSSEPVIDYLKELQHDGRATVIFNEYNYGFTYAVNQGISVSDPESDIVLLNNDALPVSGAFKLMSKFSAFKDDVGAVVPAQVLEPDTKTMKIHVPYANESHYCDVNVSVHHENVDDVPLFSDGTYLKMKFAPFFCVYFPRKVIDLLGGLDAELGRHYRSDRLYSNQITQYLNKSIYYLPDSIVIHKLQKSTEFLKSKGNAGFDEMFKKNIWPEDMLTDLGYRARRWYD